MRVHARRVVASGAVIAAMTLVIAALKPIAPVVTQSSFNPILIAPLVALVLAGGSYWWARRRRTISP